MNDKREGEGECLFADGISYKGNFENDKISGIGKAVYPDGRIYVG